MMKRAHTIIVLLVLSLGVIACSRQEDPGFEPQADSSGWNMLESGRDETPTPVIEFGNPDATPAPTAKFEIPPTVTPVAGLVAGGSAGGSGGRGGSTAGGGATKGTDGGGGGGAAVAATPQTTKETGSGGSGGSSGGSSGSSGGSSGGSGGSSGGGSGSGSSGGSSGGGSGSGSSGGSSGGSGGSSSGGSGSGGSGSGNSGSGSGANRPTATPRPPQATPGTGGEVGGAARPTATPRPTQTPRPATTPRGQATPTPRGGTPDPTRTPRFTATPIPPTSTPVPIVSNAPAFNESPVYDQFDRDLLIRNMEVTRDSFRSFLDSWRPILLNQRDRNRGDCSTYLGWYSQWVTQAPVFRTVPAVWAPIYSEYRVMLRDAVYISNSIRRMCPGAAADPTYRPTNEETVAWFETNYPRSEQLLTRAYGTP